PPNSIAEAYKMEINEKGLRFLDEAQKERLKRIDTQYKDYKIQLTEVNESLNRLEPQLDSLKRQQESNEGLRKSFKERIADLEIKRAELLRIYTESYPGVISIDSELDSLNRKLESLPVVKGVNVLQRDVSEKRAIYNKLQKNLAQLEKQKESLSSAIKEPPAIIEQYATRPHQPIGDLNKADIYKRAIYSGLLIGVIISLAVTAVKDTIVSEFEISNIPGFPLVATVPFIKPKRGQKVKPITAGKKRVGTHLLLSYDDSSEYVNAYRSLTTHIRLDAFKGNIDKKVLVFTSPNGKIGKSTIAANLAIILARLGKRIVLLDANLNRGSVAKFFGIGAKAMGISDILSGKANLEDCLKGITDMLLSGSIDWDIVMETYGLDRLKILPAGKRVHDPAGLLESDAVAELFRKLRERFDCVVVDSPGLLRNPDSIILSPNADGIFLVCKINSTSHRDLIKCSKKLAEVKIQFKGSILVCT
ncbi:MAG: P-loop NTPase, partial [Candidatus Omnitrophota bacterium]